MMEPASKAYHAYTRQLLELGQERTRLTKSLVVLVNAAAREIAQGVDAGRSVMVEGAGQFKVVKFMAHLDEARYLAIVQDGEERIFTDESEPGSKCNVRGDIACRATVATRDEFLLLVNNLGKVIRAFEASEEAVIDELRKAIVELKTLASSN